MRVLLLPAAAREQYHSCLCSQHLHLHIAACLHSAMKLACSGFSVLHVGVSTHSRRDAAGRAHCHCLQLRLSSSMAAFAVHLDIRTSSRSVPNLQLTEA